MTHSLLLLTLVIRCSCPGQSAIGLCAAACRGSIDTANPTAMVHMHSHIAHI
jgi:hypothetical protein